MKVTVCELANDPSALAEDWQNLVDHVRSQKSELVLLPEMPFSPWMALSKTYRAETWQASVETHRHWMTRLGEMAPTAILGTCPVTINGHRLNEAFVWDDAAGYMPAHYKRCLPDEEGWWEASWYERGPDQFQSVQNRCGRIGFLICTELWFNRHGRAYGEQGVEILACPRATGSDATDKWIAGGRAAAVVSGAYCLSSNFSATDEDPMPWGGSGWIIEPENGEVMGVTSRQQPFLTLDVDLARAATAKHTYPRYVLE